MRSCLNDKCTKKRIWEKEWSGGSKKDEEVFCGELVYNKSSLQCFYFHNHRQFLADIPATLTVTQCFKNITQKLKKENYGV